jgi:hypothetical protein
MKRATRTLIVCLALLCLAGLALAKDKSPKSGPLTGTWQCTSHGGPQGDMEFTLYLTQDKETVTGSVSSPIGSTDLNSATFKKKKLEIHIDSPQTKYLLTGTYKKGELSGDWSTDSDLKGTWEGKKTASTANQP